MTRLVLAVLALAVALAPGAAVAQAPPVKLGLLLPYTGVLSVCLGFTLQVVAQRHTRPADSAIVLSSETVFTAAFGAVFMGDRMGAAGLAGCALILACILVVQLQPIVWRWFADARARAA